MMVDPALYLSYFMCIYNEDAFAMLIARFTLALGRLPTQEEAWALCNELGRALAMYMELWGRTLTQEEVQWFQDEVSNAMMARWQGSKGANAPPDPAPALDLEVWGELLDNL